MNDQLHSKQAVPVPRVLAPFRAYLVFLCLIYAFLIVLGVIFVFFPSHSSWITREQVSPAQGWGLLAMGSVFLLASGVSFFLKPRPGAWLYNLVLIFFGMSSCCLLPFSILLLVFWLKPETRNYFGRTDG